MRNEDSMKETIPRIFKKIYNHMDLNHYINLKKSLEFNESTVLLCNECYVKIISKNLLSGSK